MLTTEPEHLVTVDELVDELWPDGPPRSAVPNVRTYAANLRRAFQAAAGSEGALVVRQGNAYRLQLRACQLDLIQFTADCAQARTLINRGSLEHAEKLLNRALGRWQGRMLAGLPLGPVLAGRVAAAEEQRCDAVELLARLWIGLGRPERAVFALRDLLAREPLRESAHALLVEALHRHGDRSGALSAYASARQILARHLGVEPGTELRMLRKAILAGSTAGTSVMNPHARLEPEERSSVSEGGRRGEQVDRLPRAVPDFIGRTDVIDRLLLETGQIEDRSSAVHLIDGMAGSGKTTLAVHLARLLAVRYPDAQLFIDLGGHGKETPVESAAALAVLLRQLGVPGGRIPVDLDDRIDLWRRELASRRVVVLLDNAASTEQVRPILPVAAGAVVIVTSRRRLAGLDARPPESLPPMTEEEGIALLASAAGGPRVLAERAAAAAVVRYCGRLPLAIRLAGARLAHRPAWRLSDLARLLADGTGGLLRMTVEERNLAGAFATSYEPTSPSAKQMFRLLSVHPGREFTLPLAAAISDESLVRTAEALDELIDGHLVEEVARGRYRMHDLIRHYAAELSMECDTPKRREMALAHLLDFILHASLSAADVLEDGLARAQVSMGEPRRPDLLTVSRRGIEWFEEERSTIVALVGRAHQAGFHNQTWRLTRTIWRFCYMRAYFDDIIHTHRLGLAAARSADDPAATALMCNYLASAYVRTGNYRDALELLTTAVAISERERDRPNLFRFRANLVVVYWLRGDLEAAVAVGIASIRDPRGYRPDEIPANLPNLGLALTTLGRYEDALHVHRLHLYWARAHGNYFHITNALGHIGSVKARMGKHAAAIRILRASLMLRDRTGHRYAEAEVQNDLGVALRGLGRLSASVRQHELALRLALESGERHVQAAALNELGSTLDLLGDTDGSTEKFSAALALATRISHPYEQGRALAGLAGLAVAQDVDAAKRYWERASAIFQRMGVPERFEVERRLAEIAGDPAQPR
ncbi:BTAD domain-containing putative transcriptional regulator [Micromonospora sp. H33]|uniref:AfsR/SARP family transcriptional regulator n=1 Tax=Micromonospora sp. H33 TaxID=3452215 RepID=UPI003F88B40B